MIVNEASVHIFEDHWIPTTPGLLSKLPFWDDSRIFVKDMIKSRQEWWDSTLVCQAFDGDKAVAIRRTPIYIVLNRLMLIFWYVVSKTKEFSKRLVYKALRARRTSGPSHPLAPHGKTMSYKRCAPPYSTPCGSVSVEPSPPIQEEPLIQPALSATKNQRQLNIY